MLKRITLHNFMSHAHTEIELSPGLTVLTGPNNCGKSAFVLALQSLVENTRGSFMIRHGAKECRVIVETFDGHTIEWKRKKKTAGYIIDGEYKRNPGDDVLAKVLRLAKVKSGDSDEFDVHFGEQKSPIFLLGDRGSRAARFFASSSDASVLIEMQKLHRSKVKVAQQEFQRLQAEQKQNAATLELLAPVPDLETRLETLDQTFQALQAESQQIQQLETLIQGLVQASERVELDARRAACLSDLPTELQQENERPLEALVQRWQGIEQEQQCSQVAVTALQPLSDPPTIEDESALATLIRETQLQTGICQHSAATHSCLDDLEDPPQLTDPDNLEKLIARLSAAAERVQLDRQEAELLAACVPPPELVDGARLAQFCQQWTAAETHFLELKEIHAEAEAEYEQGRLEMLHWVEENPTCPTCGAELEPDQFIQSAETGLRGHTHGA
ncbi:AAA family ATPase [Gimesia panareensis]|uniref:Chromosome segregation protein n=1 Tax=Gimesia panareensis TaxID=2527978 RepID=A0A517Q8X5_9PLAN|nr:AAA family ATPase [Gimesia panareensis]QDT28089.1 chromosome segregation protein [Gimesia panareensis]